MADRGAGSISLWVHQQWPASRCSGAQSATGGSGALGAAGAGFGAGGLGSAFGDGAGGGASAVSGLALSDATTLASIAIALLSASSAFSSAFVVFSAASFSAGCWGPQAPAASANALTAIIVNPRILASPFDISGRVTRPQNQILSPAKRFMLFASSPSERRNRRVSPNARSYSTPMYGANSGET